MGRIWLNTRNIALCCAAVLLLLSIGAILRETGVWKREHQSLISPTPGTSTLNQSKDMPKETAQENPPMAEGQNQNPQPTEQPPTEYSYTASLGDSYTAFARDAIRQYLAAKKIEATPDQLFKTEIRLINEANSPMLDIGQSVSISHDAITNALKESGVGI